jgi:predicted lipid-binding transport protein (Tim44 family)
MNKIIVALLVLFGIGVLSMDADARRLGGGSSVGKQRSVAPPAPRAPAAAPTTPPAQPAPASGMSRWLGPLAGLALGAGLASLFLNHGFAGALGGILMIGLLIAAALFLLRMLRGRPQPPQTQYASAGASSVRPADISTGFGGGAPPAAAPADRYPPGFDAEQFTRHAKLNFTQLQAANDRRDLTTLRDFMTPELYAEIAAGFDPAAAAQHTDVVTLDAEVLEVITENSHYVASVRFSGMIRERADGAAEPFSEVWHLEKPLAGDTGWLISGIQQD